MTEHEQRVLELMVSKEFVVLTFDAISQATKLDREIVRKSCRSLRDKGLLDYATGGEVGGGWRGAGYVCRDKKAAELALTRMGRHS